MSPTIVIAIRFLVFLTVACGTFTSPLASTTPRPTGSVPLAMSDSDHITVPVAMSVFVHSQYMSAGRTPGTAAA